MPEHRVVITDRGSESHELIVEPGGAGDDTVNLRVCVEDDSSEPVQVAMAELRDAVAYVNAKENE